MSLPKLMSKIRRATRRIFCRRREPASRNSLASHRRRDEQSDWLYRSPAIQSRGTPAFADMDTAKAFEDKQKRIETEVGGKYASFRVIGIEDVEQK